MLNVTEERVRDKMKDYFFTHYPEMIMTKRIENNLAPIIYDGLKKADREISSERLDNALGDFFQKDEIMTLVKECQPNVKKIPDDVVDSIRDYFKNNLANYELVTACRKSNNQEDDYLYMVVAKKNDNDYACWTSWNSTTDSLNYGHYSLPDLKTCYEILAQHYTNITSPNETYDANYGMTASMYHFDIDGKNNSQDPVNATEQPNVVRFRHRAGR